MVLNKQTKADGNHFKITVGLHGVITVSLIKHGRCFQYQKNRILFTVVVSHSTPTGRKQLGSWAEIFTCFTTDKKQTVNMSAVIYWPVTCKCLPMGKVKIMIV